MQLWHIFKIVLVKNQVNC